MKIYLIRHGQTDWNIQGKIQGSHDIPLNETGRRQAELLAKGMDSRPVLRIFSSTLTRAMETAEKIRSRQKVEICSMPQLIEVEFGKWEGMTWDEIMEAYPEEYKRWALCPDEASPPGGENQDQVLNRCVWAVKEILRITGGREDVAIVSHGATIAYLVSYMMQNHPEVESIIVENASITTVNYSPLTEDFMLLEMNDTSHMEE
ncbi:MAG: histidine phosphatase family protein [Lacrimispora sphenoides]|uniref:Alpha-ribazole phosphatase/probable phosphoglycerate mutase n=1 Tax=Lacrimispora sphenoides JCM 1415 TaxID=1297793 RepID=A0ABY1C3L1_9FIRM|nr:histidine phosphatase family protein [Lacrimispora sphenoides]SET61301.1 alpha-ribazole phosphatase/probable phosphoglycerate mutase [[Clostridium] sphenoides JCM 1415]SUY50059.1 phosphoglycerate mutase [Lacrimispora sphenoides]